MCAHGPFNKNLHCPCGVVYAEANVRAQFVSTEEAFFMHLKEDNNVCVSVLVVSTILCWEYKVKYSV